MAEKPLRLMAYRVAITISAMGNSFFVFWEKIKSQVCLYATINHLFLPQTLSLPHKVFEEFSLYID